MEITAEIKRALKKLINQLKKALINFLKNLGLIKLKLIKYQIRFLIM